MTDEARRPSRLDALAEAINVRLGQEHSSIDQDAVDACADLVGRTGAVNFEIGARSDQPGARWYAQARYKGAPPIEVEADDPAGAADAMSRRILRGGKCAHCHRTVVLGGNAIGYCRWTRVGPKWLAGCPAGREAMT
jgi:hypothetical protein